MKPESRCLRCRNKQRPGDYSPGESDSLCTKVDQYIGNHIMLGTTPDFCPLPAPRKKIRQFCQDRGIDLLESKKELVADSPIGKHFAANYCHSIVSSRWDDETIEDCWKDIWNSLQYGLEDCEEDCETCFG